jgi:hypothetical protein
LRRYYALFFIAHGSRRVWLAGCTTNPTGVWVTQQARNLGLDFSEQSDWLLILNRRHLELVLRAYVGNYNRERPHRALQLRPPKPNELPEKSPEGAIRRRDRLGGLIHEYYRAAA